VPLQFGFAWRTAPLGLLGADWKSTPTSPRIAAIDRCSHSWQLSEERRTSFGRECHFAVAGRNARSRLDPAIPLTAAGAIFGALVGTTLLDVSNSRPYIRVIDLSTQALWIPVFLLFALLAAWPDSTRLRYSAWIFAGAAAILTAGVIFVTGFGFTRDTDHVRLILDHNTADRIKQMCGLPIPSDQIKGEVRTKSLGSDFVIFDFDNKTSRGCKTVDIPRRAVLGFQELH
jgi:hypothetical protein